MRWGGGQLAGPQGARGFCEAPIGWKLAFKRVAGIILYRAAEQRIRIPRGKKGQDLHLFPNYPLDSDDRS